MKDMIICPSCEAVLDRYTLYTHDCVCIECGNFIDVDELGGEDMSRYPGYENGLDNYWDNYDYEEDEVYNKFYRDKEFGEGGKSVDKKDNSLIKDEEDQISCFVLRFLTEASYEVIKESFSSLDADIDYLTIVSDGPLTKFVKSASGQKLLTGLKIENKKLEEYFVVVSIFLDQDNESKKIFVSTLSQAFPLCIIREEGSSYIMANNKGLAKGIGEQCNKDEVQLLSLFLTGFEKYKILTHYLYWCEPYKKEQAKEIMIGWDQNTLIDLESLRRPERVPVIWQEYLCGLEDIKVSKNDKDAGTTISFEEMLEDVYDEEDDKDKEENLVQLISLRGINDFALGSDGEEGTEDVKK